VPDPVNEVLIAVFGLRGLDVPNLSQVTPHLSDAVPAPQGPVLPMPGQGTPELDEPDPPKKHDGILVMFHDEQHILLSEAQRPAFEAAHFAAVHKQGFGVIIREAGRMQVETFQVVKALGQAAEVGEVSVYVTHLR
jgi:hypothetical protein